MIDAFQENKSVLYYFLLKLSLKTWKQLSYSFLAETCQFNRVNIIFTYAETTRSDSDYYVGNTVRQ